MSHLVDLTGKRFGRLTVLSRYGSTKNKMATWLCLCDCGNQKVVATCHLNSGATQSCGCLHREKASEANKTHNCTNTRLYCEWQQMKKRCYWKNYKAYDLYGGRGITVCDEWKNSFESFQSWAINNGYSNDLTLDRIDNDKGYEPSNCRWATKFEQSNNRKFNVIVTYRGESDVFEGMCRKLNVNTGTIKSRMKKKGFTFEEAVDYGKTAPYVNYTEIAKKRGYKRKYK